jgi:hypothetical protein
MTHRRRGRARHRRRATRSDPCSRGGRPDLAGDALPRVIAATLLIIGGNDTPVIALNRATDETTHARQIRSLRDHHLTTSNRLATLCPPDYAVIGDR